MNKRIKNFSAHEINMFSYDDYIRNSYELIENTDPEELDEKGTKNHNYRILNKQRLKRINRTFKPKTEISELISKIDRPQNWLIITEDWCGDSAQNLPYIINYTDQNPLIEISVILRDENLNVIDKYFEEGNPRSIPKIVGFDDNGEQLFVWGPRPKVAQDLVKQLKAEGYSREEFNKELHLWYSKNKGEEIQKEFFAILKNIIE